MMMIVEEEEEYPRVDSNGSLGLNVENWDVGSWIEDNTDSLLSVQSLELNAQSLWGKIRREIRIPDSIEKFTELTRLFIEGVELLYLPNTVKRLPKLIHIGFRYCEFKEMPANLGMLPSLQRLSVDRCRNIKSLPNSIATLSTLTSLNVESCESLTELPANLGQLKSLTRLTLHHCDGITELPASLGQLESLTYLSLEWNKCIKSLPNSMENLYKLETLSIAGCESLTELPVNLNVLNLQLDRCYIRFLPNINLQRLSIFHPFRTKQRPIKLGLRSLQQLYLEGDDFPTDLHELPGLMLLDISGSTIKWLSWSITKLRELQFLFLPTSFRLQTLPPHLNDSLIVSVKGKHVRRNWKQLKTEIYFPFPPVEYGLAMQAAQCHSFISPDPSYIPYVVEIKPSSYNFYKPSVQILNLEPDIEHFIWKLEELSHLYISHCKFFHNFPEEVTRPRYISLDVCDIRFLSKILIQLSSLETLELIETELPANMEMLVNLKHLSLRSSKLTSLPNSLEKLPNLNTLELYKCFSLNSLPENLKLAKLKYGDCTFKSLPAGLLHLEVIHSKRFRHYRDNHDSLDECLIQLVNLETLSITCYEVEYLPSIAKLRNLRELQLKDCFSLKELPSNVAELVKLCTLNISGTRIQSLPDSITELHNFQQLILPKCFKQESLPGNLKQVSITDDTNGTYYKYMGYYYPRYGTSMETCNEGNDIAPNPIPVSDEVVAGKPLEGVVAQNPADFILEVDEAVSEEPEQNVIAKKILAHRPLNLPLSNGPDIVIVDYDVEILESVNAQNSAEVDEVVPEESEQNPPPEKTNLSLPNAPNDMDCYEQTLEEGVIAQNPIDSIPEIDEEVSKESEQNAIAQKTSTHRQLNLSLLNAPNNMDNYEQTFEEGVIAENPADSTMEIAQKTSSHARLNLSLSNAPNARDDYGQTLEGIIADNPADSIPKIDEAVSEESEQKAIAQVTSSHRELNLSLLNAPNAMDYYEHTSEEGVIAPNPAGKEDHAATCVDDSSVESDANSHGANSFTENIQLDLRNGQVNTINSECEDGNNPHVSENQLNEKHRSGNDKGKTQRIVITKEMIQPYLLGKKSLVDAAKGLKVGRSTLKRRLKEDLEMVWPSSKKGKQNLNRKSTKNNGKSPLENNSSQHNLVNPINQLAPEHTDGANECASSNYVRRNESSSTFTVKAIYKDDIVKFDFSLTSSMEQLKEEVGKQLEQLVVSKIKIKYEDEDGDWILLNEISKLYEPLRLSRSSGRSVVKLLILEKT